MIKILNLIYKVSFLLCISLSIHGNAMEMVDFTETTEGLVRITSKNNYPKQAFDSKKFIDEIDNNINFTDNSIIALDLSNDFTVNEKILGTILFYFKRGNISLSFLNISRTNVRAEILNDLKDLLNDEKFKYLDISGTPAVKTAEDFSQNPKIIFITKDELYNLKKELKKTFGEELINRHIKYYIEKGPYL